MATDRDQFTISSATGVDLTLDIAGPGSRSYAFVIDWCYRALLAFAWFFVAALATLGRVFPEKGAMDSASYALFAIVPAVTIYLLYHPVLELAMKGRTPGKRKAGIRIVTATGATPSTGAILIRNLFRLIDTLPALYAVGLVSTIITAQRVRIGDLAAGTVLIYDHANELGSLTALGSLAAENKIDPAVLEIAQDLLTRWRQMDSEPRNEIARALLVRIDSSQDPKALEGLKGGVLRKLIEAALHTGSAP